MFFVLSRAWDKEKIRPQTFGFRAPMLWTIPSSELTISLILYTLRCSFKGSKDKIHRVSQQTLRFFVWKKILGSLFFRATQLLLAQRHGTLYSVRSTIFLAIWYPGRIRTKEKRVSMKAQNSKAEISQWLKPDLRDHWIVDPKRSFGRSIRN